MSIRQRRPWDVWMGAWMAFSSCTATAASVDVPRMERDINQQVSMGRFMGSVLLARNGKVLINKGYGFAEVATKTPNGPDTEFRLGSVTKQFTAACIMLLEERGKLKVEDRPNKYLPDTPAGWDGITIFNLLTHTSGIPNFTDFVLPNSKMTVTYASAFHDLAHGCSNPNRAIGETWLSDSGQSRLSRNSE